MGDLMKSGGGGGLMGLLHSQNGELTMPKPFEREIFLFDTYIAGTSFIEGIEELEQHLSEGDKLDFFREPDNKYDSKAYGRRQAPLWENYLEKRLRQMGENKYQSVFAGVIKDYYTA